MATQRQDVIITVNGKQATAILDAVKKRASDLRKEMANLAQLGQQSSQRYRDMEAELRNLTQTTKNFQVSMNTVENVMKNLGGATMAQLNRAIREASRNLRNMSEDNPDREKLVQSIREMTRQVKVLKGELAQVGNLDDFMKPGRFRHASMDELRAAAQKAREEMNRLDRSTSEYAKRSEQLRKINNEINKGTEAISNQAGAMTHHLKNLVAYMGLYGVLDTLKTKITDVWQANLKLSDQLADIRKVSGLAIRDVNKLNVNLAKIDTRTTMEEMNSIAYEGAKLGMGDKYGVEGLEGFTRAANQVNVALREELGDEALTQLSKMVEVMGLIPKMGVEQSMLHTASAMFQLASSSTSSANNIVEFSKRLTGVARTAGITTDQLLALGSAADSMGLTPEVASTAFSQLITSIQTKHNLIEKQLDIDPGTINQLYSAGKAMDAIVLIFEKMNEKGNMNALQGLFKDMGTEGTRIINVMSTMAKNADMLKDQLAVGKRAFEEGTAVSKEYAIQQETAQAYMERASNLWNKAFVNPDGVDAVHQMAVEWYNLSKELNTSDAWLGQVRTSLTLVAQAFTALMWLLPSIVAGLGAIGLQKLVVGFGMAVKAIYGFVTSVRVAGTVWTAFQTVLKTNVFGIVVGAASALYLIISELVSKEKEAVDITSQLNGHIKKMESNIAMAQYEARQYYEAIMNTAQGTDAHRVAIENFNKKFGTYYKNQLTEASSAYAIGRAYEEVNKQLRIKAQLEAQEEIVKDIVQPGVKTLSDRSFDYNEKLSKGGKGVNKALNSDEIIAMFNDLRNKNKGAFGPDMAVRALAKRLGVTDELEIQRAIKNRGRSTMDVTLSARGAKLSDEQRGRINQLNWGSKLVPAYGSLVNRQNKADAASKTIGLVTDDPWKGQPQEEKPGNLSVLAEDKAAKAARKKAERERLQAFREENKDAQVELKALIDNVKNFYDLQMNAMLEKANSEGWEQQMVEQATRLIKLRMNVALSESRKAIAQIPTNNWDEIKKQMEEQIIEQPDSNGYSESRELLSRIQATDPNKVYQTITKNSAELGNNPRALIDQVYHNATKNEQANLNLEQKQIQERRKAELERNYTGKVNSDYTQQMEGMGFFGTQGMMEAQMKVMHAQSELDKRKAEVAKDTPLQKHFSNYVPDAEAELDKATQEYNKSVEQHSKTIANVLESARQNIVALYSIDNPASEGGKDALLKILFGEDYANSDDSEVKAIINMGLDDMQVFYNQLIKYSDEYTEAVKKAADEREKVYEIMWDYSQEGQAYKQMISDAEVFQSGTSQYDRRIQDRKAAGEKVPRHDTYGGTAFVDSFSADPEIEMYKAKMQVAAAYYDFMERKGAEDKQLAEQQRKIIEAESEYAKAMVAQVKQQINDIYGLMSPIEDFGSSVGEAFALMTEDAEKGRAALKAALGDMINAFMKQTVEMTKEYIKRRIMQETNDRITSQRMHDAAGEQVEIEEDKEKGLTRAVAVGKDGTKRILTNWAKKAVDLTKDKAQEEQEVEKESEDKKQKIADNGSDKKENIFKKGWKGLKKLFTKSNKEEVKLEKDKQDDVTDTVKTGTEAQEVLNVDMKQQTADAVSEIGDQALQTQQAQTQTEVQTESAETQAAIPMGIAKGASKIIGSLGWWGIPLVAVITALLNGLLSFAMSKVTSLFGGGGSSDDGGTQAKLVTGMLTYDSGNVQAFRGVEDGKTYPVVGNDGKVYAAKDGGELSTGLVKDPITTLVNGQPALVAERGPEMVIGRETTAALMMARPELLAEIVKFDRNRSGQTYRAYDAGNLDSFSIDGSGNGLSSEDVAGLRSTISTLATVLTALQTNGIRAHMNTFEATRDIEKARQFMKKNSGDSLWKR